MVLDSSDLGADPSPDLAMEKAATAKLRTRLSTMGLRGDLDRDIPEGIRAWCAGLLGEFYDFRLA